MRFSTEHEYCPLLVNSVPTMSKYEDESIVRMT